jgi:hypothetical protein
MDRVPALSTYKLSKLSDILKKIEHYQDAHETAWFRGVGGSEYPLLPSIARLPGKTADEIIEVIEPGIAAVFAQRSPPFIDRDLSDAWRSLFFMQHYGVPTRLLDWTESPFVALYFALASVKRDANGAPTTDAAVWLCDPSLWNQKALAHISYGGGILDESCEEIKAYAPGEKLTQIAVIPVMIYGAHNSPRIVAQRGVFALFGKAMKSMQEIYAKESFKKGTLQRIVIERGQVEGLLKSLFKTGISESVVYPDLFGLSLEIRRKFGYSNG